MLALILTTLGVFWLWEFALILPFTLPSWLQPLVVLGLSVGLSWPDWRTGAAAAGLVGILHVVVNHLLNAAPVVEPVRKKFPKLPV